MRKRGLIPKRKITLTMTTVEQLLRQTYTLEMRLDEYDGRLVTIAARAMSLPYDERLHLLKTLRSRLPDYIADRVNHNWPLWARPTQLPPDDPWNIWLLLAGRGFGKTRTGAEWVRARVESGLSSDNLKL